MDAAHQGVLKIIASFQKITKKINNLGCLTIGRKTFSIKVDDEKISFGLWRDSMKEDG